MHQVLTVSMPGLHIRNQLQSHCLARSLYLMTCHHLAVFLSHSHQCAWNIGDVVPLDSGTELRVVTVLLHTQTLAIEEEFHLVAIGISVERNLLACLTVPVFRKLSGRNIDAIPLDVTTRLFDNTDVNGWLVSKHTLHEISIRLWLKRKVEHTLIPTLDRPSHTLTEVIDGSPIGQSEYLIAVHLIEIWSHRSHTRLALIEGFLRITLHIAWEVHIAVVVRIHFCCHSQVGRNRISLQVAITGMHRHGGESGIVITVQQFLLEFISRHAPIIKRQVAVLL